MRTWTLVFCYNKNHKYDPFPVTALPSLRSSWPVPYYLSFPAAPQSFSDEGPAAQPLILSSQLYCLRAANNIFKS